MECTLSDSRNLWEVYNSEVGAAGECIVPDGCSLREVDSGEGRAVLECIGSNRCSNWKTDGGEGGTFSECIVANRCHSIILIYTTNRTANNGILILRLLNNFSISDTSFTHQGTSNLSN